MYSYTANATEEEKQAAKAEAERHTAQFSGLDYYSANGEEVFFLQYENGVFTRCKEDDPGAMRFSVEWEIDECNHDIGDIYRFVSKPELGQLYVDRERGIIHSLETTDLPSGEFFIGGYQFDYAPYCEDDGDFLYARANMRYVRFGVVEYFRTITSEREEDDERDLNLEGLPPFAIEGVNDDLEEIAITTDCPSDLVFEWAGEIALKLEEKLQAYEKAHYGQHKILVRDLPRMDRNSFEYFQSESSKFSPPNFTDEAEHAKYLAQDYLRADAMAKGHIWPVSAKLRLYGDSGRGSDLLADVWTFQTYDDEKEYHADVIGQHIWDMVSAVEELQASREEVFGALA
jgi:hypothetical protein